MKKVVSLLLVVVLALGMSTMAFAKIDGVKTTANSSYTSNKGTMNAGGTGLELGTVKAGDTVVINLSTGSGSANAVFTDDGKTPVIGTAGVTRSDISKGRVTLRTQVAKGSGLFFVEWEYKGTQNLGAFDKLAGIKIEFNDPFVSNDPDGKDFDFDVYMVVDGDRYQDQGVNVTGTIANKELFVDADDDYANFEDGNIITASEYVKSIELALNDSEDIIAYARLFKDKSVYAHVSDDPTDAQITVMDQYGIDQVFNVSSVGLQGVTERIVFQNADPDTYVYDGDLNYLGQVKDANFEYKPTYYLAAKKLDVDEEEEEIEDDDEFPEAPPVTGDSDYEENDNFNPSTGA